MIHCFKCGSDIPDNMIYCLHCGERLDAEPETVVKENPIPTEPPKSIIYVVFDWVAKAVAASAIFLLVMAAGCLVLAGLIIYGSWGSTNQTSGNTAQSVPLPEPIPPTPKSPSPTPRKTKPTPAPVVNRDAEMERIVESQRRQREYDAETRRIQQMGNRPANIPPPVIREYDQKGQQLRAICKNGEPSYWQYDKFATCGMNGGVFRWNPRHPRN